MKVKEGGVIEVLKPVAAKAPMHILPADRPTSLHNKTGFLVVVGGPAGKSSYTTGVGEGITVKIEDGSW